MNIARHIEHTNLSPVITVDDVDRLVAEAVEHQFIGVCVPPFWVKRARRQIGNDAIVLSTVAGFPLGFHMTETKLEEINRALDDGADEIDLVWNLSAFRSGMPWAKIELAKCSHLIHTREKIIKVIIETGYLSPSELDRACALCADAGADFVKTSTGFGPAGATPEVVSRMRRLLPEGVEIKASGGIKEGNHARQLIAAGASRIGTSSGVRIVSENQTIPS